MYSVGEDEVPYHCTVSLLLSIALFASVCCSYSDQTLSDKSFFFTCIQYFALQQHSSVHFINSVPYNVFASHVASKSLRDGRSFSGRSGRGVSVPTRGLFWAMVVPPTQNFLNLFWKMCMILAHWKWNVCRRRTLKCTFYDYGVQIKCTILTRSNSQGKDNDKSNMASSCGGMWPFNFLGVCPSSSLCSYVPGAGFRFVTLPIFTPRALRS